jgi:hypothetical protein
MDFFFFDMWNSRPGFAHAFQLHLYTLLKTDKFILIAIYMK